MADENNGGLEIYNYKNSLQSMLTVLENHLTRELAGKYSFYATQIQLALQVR
jgi:hypothetical protein